MQTHGSSTTMSTEEPQGWEVLIDRTNMSYLALMSSNRECIAAFLTLRENYKHVKSDLMRIFEAETSTFSNPSGPSNAPHEGCIYVPLHASKLQLFPQKPEPHTRLHTNRVQMILTKFLQDHSKQPKWATTIRQILAGPPTTIPVTKYARSRRAIYPFSGIELT